MIYTRANLKSRINAGIKGKIGMLVNDDDTINQAVRFVVADIDMVSNIRNDSLSPSLFSDIYEYACPSDLNGYKIISIDPQTDELSDQYNLVPSTEFGSSREIRTIAIKDDSGSRKLLISAEISDDTLVVSTLDSLTAGGGTWETVGDAESLAADNDDYVKGSASLKFDIGTGGTTTAGIVNSTLDEFDLETTYLNGNGVIFHWFKIVSTTNLTNFILKIGDGASSYITKTITTQSDGTAFKNGWNLLRFNLTGYTTVGSPTLTACDYTSIYMTKTAGKISEVGYRADHIMAKNGEIHEVNFYSRYGWQNTSGTWMENSTSDTDLLNAGPEEYNLMIQKGVELASDEVDEETASAKAERKYKEQKERYEDSNPSEAMFMTSTYKTFQQDA